MEIANGLKRAKRAELPVSPGTIRYGTGASPLGPILVAVSAHGICGLFVLIDDPGYSRALDRLRGLYPDVTLIEDSTVASAISPRVTAYLQGTDDCRDLKLDMTQGTRFQQRVWELLRRIPRGETRSYGEVAAEAGHPRAARAVGTACGLNPVSLLVPCHRVIAAGGAIGGYGWGVERKRALLDLERS